MRGICLPGNILTVNRPVETACEECGNRKKANGRRMGIAAQEGCPLGLDT